VVASTVISSVVKLLDRRLIAPKFLEYSYCPEPLLEESAAEVFPFDLPSSPIF